MLLTTITKAKASGESEKRVMWVEPVVGEGRETSYN